MGELKGQILAILLVLTVFGVIAATVKVMFRNAASDMSDRLSDQVLSLDTALDVTIDYYL